MKSTLLYLGFFILFLTTSCGSYHYTGDRTGSKWTDKDIALAEKEVNKVRSEVKKSLKKDTKAYMDCYMFQVIHNYDNFHQANLDMEGCTRLAAKCIKEF